MRTKTQTKKWYDRAVQWLVYSLGFVVPLVFSTSFYSNFATPKLIALRVVTLAIIFLWAWKTYREEKFTYRKGIVNYLILAVALMMVIATLTSSHLYSSLFGAETGFLGIFTQLNLLFIAVAVYNFITEKEELKKLVGITALTGVVILSVYGILQYLGYFHDSFTWSQSPQDRVFGTMGHSNHFGAYLGMCLLLSVGLFQLMKNKVLRLLLIVFQFVTVGTILLTGSRGAMVATLVSALIVCGIAIWRRREKAGKWLKNYWFWIAGAIVVVGIGGVVFSSQIAKLPLFQRINAAISTSAEGQLPDRFSWWLSSLEMIKTKPFLGFGLSTYRDDYNRYRRLDYKVPGDINEQISPESSHNEYLDIAVTEGLIGLAAFLALLGFIFLQIDKKLFQKHVDVDNSALLTGLKGALMVYLLQVLVSYGVVDTMTIFYLLLGAAASASMLNVQGEIKFNALTKNIVIIATFVVIAMGVFGTLHEARAEYFYKNAIIEENLGRPEFARGWFELSIKEQPYRYEYYQAYADFTFNTAMATGIDQNFSQQYLELALQNYQQATLLNDSHPSTFYNLGVASVQLGLRLNNDAYLRQGTNALQQTIELSPNDPLYAYGAAKIFKEIGKKDLALQAYQTVLRYDPQYKDAQSSYDKLSAPVPASSQEQTTVSP